MGDYLESPKFVDIFNTYFPIYLSYGMSYSEFWDGSPDLAIAYKKAHELNLRRRNEELWLEGVYVRYALLSTVGNMFKGKSQETIEYPTEPLAITQKEVEAKKEREAKAKFDKMKAMMNMAHKNIKRKGGVNGNN